MIICIAGPTASGKTTAATALAKRMNAVRDKYSNVLIEIAEQKGLPIDKRSLQELSKRLRRERGEDYLTKLMEQRLLVTNSRTIVLEGNRRIVDYEFISSFCNRYERTIRYVFIDAPFDVRFERFNARQKALRKESVSHDEFVRLDRDPCEDEIADLKKIYMRAGGLVIDSTDLSETAVADAIFKYLRAL